MKDELFECGSFTIGSGEDTHFREDIWLGDTPLYIKYPSLYNIVQRKQVSVVNVMNTIPLNIGFIQALTDDRGDRWMHLLQHLMNVHLTTQLNVFV
jgi:hypothetical protein